MVPKSFFHTEITNLIYIVNQLTGLYTVFSEISDVSVVTKFSIGQFFIFQKFIFQ